MTWSKKEINICFPVYNSSYGLYEKCFLFFIKDCFRIDYSTFFGNKVKDIFNFIRILNTKLFYNDIFKKSRRNINLSTKKVRFQKGTGRARSGSIKSPIFRKGSSLFVIEKRLNIKKILKKIDKYIIFYILLNKRANIIFFFLNVCIHFLDSIYDYIKRQLRLCGIVSSSFFLTFLFGVYNYRLYNNLYSKDYIVILI